VATTTGVQSTPISAGTLNECLKRKNVPIGLTNSNTYNQRLPVNPAVIVIPTTVQQVQDAVKCAASYNTKVQAKSGGHSYASFSYGGKDGSMVVNLEGFQSLVLKGEIAKVGGGMRL
jgi:FAD/FMN-containing dehydrogenase